MSLEQKVQSLQHSILFLQEQHATTLNGLHKEIERLQKNCSDLTFELSAKSSSTDVSKIGGSALKSTLEKEIRELRKENNELKKLCDAKDKRINLLEGQLKSKEQKYNDDLKILQRRVGELQIDIENKAGSIAYLTTQIQKKRTRSSDKDKVVFENIVDAKPSISPSPPRSTPMSTRRHRRPMVTSASASANIAGLIADSSSHQLVASDYVLENSLPKSNSSKFSSRYKQSLKDPPRPAVGHSQVQRERDLRLSCRPKPSDYEDFIRITQTNDIIAKANVEPLPPITTRSGCQLRDPNLMSLSRNKKITNKKDTVTTTGEVETICVENNLTSPDRQHRFTAQNSSAE